MSAIADYASVTKDGKLNVMGIFDAIYTSKFPARHSTMVFAFRIRWEWEDSEKDCRVVLHVEDEDGHKVLSLDGQMKSPKVEPGMYASHNQIFNFRDVVFQKAGQYRFRLKIADKLEYLHPLTLIKL